MHACTNLALACGHREQRSKLNVQDLDLAWLYQLPAALAAPDGSLDVRPLLQTCHPIQLKLVHFLGRKPRRSLVLQPEQPLVYEVDNGYAVLRRTPQEWHDWQGRTRFSLATHYNIHMIIREAKEGIAEQIDNLELRLSYTEEHLLQDRTSEIEYVSLQGDLTRRRDRSALNTPADLGCDSRRLDARNDALASVRTAPEEVRIATTSLMFDFVSPGTQDEYFSVFNVLPNLQALTIPGVIPVGGDDVWMVKGWRRQGILADGLLAFAAAVRDGTGGVASRTDLPPAELPPNLSKLTLTSFIGHQTVARLFRHQITALEVRTTQYFSVELPRFLVHFEHLTTLQLPEETVGSGMAVAVSQLQQLQRLDAMTLAVDEGFVSILPCSIICVHNLEVKFERARGDDIPWPFPNLEKLVVRKHAGMVVRVPSSVDTQQLSSQYSGVVHLAPTSQSVTKVSGDWTVAAVHAMISRAAAETGRVDIDLQHFEVMQVLQMLSSISKTVTVHMSFRVEPSQIQLTPPDSSLLQLFAECSARELVVQSTSAVEDWVRLAAFVFQAGGRGFEFLVSLKRAVPHTEWLQQLPVEVDSQQVNSLDVEDHSYYIRYIPSSLNATRSAASQFINGRAAAVRIVLGLNGMKVMLTDQKESQVAGIWSVFLLTSRGDTTDDLLLELQQELAAVDMPVSPSQDVYTTTQ